MEREGYRANDGDRCYFCKAELLDVLDSAGAPRTGWRRVATGTNADDAPRRLPAGDPGRGRARVRSTPLQDAGFTKAQVRAASRRWDLPTWDKPAAACLSSRVAYGIEVTPAPAGAGRARRGRRTPRARRRRDARPRPAGA